MATATRTGQRMSRGGLRQSYVRAQGAIATATLDKAKGQTAAAVAALLEVLPGNDGNDGTERGNAQSTRLSTRLASLQQMTTLAKDLLKKCNRERLELQREIIRLGGDL